MQVNRLYFVLICLIALGACGTNQPTGGVDDNFQGQINSFVQEGLKRGVNLDVSNLSVHYGGSLSIALCNNMGVSQEILVNDAKYNEAPPLLREWIFYHELGHCLLNRPHLNTMIQMDGRSVPASLMHSSAFDVNAMSDHLDYYLDELFDN